MSVTFNVRSATGPELLKFFNANTGGNQVSKFRDRETAEKRVQRLVDEMKAEEMVEEMGIKSQKEASDFIAKQLGASGVLLDEIGSEDPTDAEIEESNKIQHSELAVVKAACANVDRDSTKPWQRAKVIICDMLEAGKTSRKEIIAACVAAGIKYNTADGCHYEMCVKGRAK